MTRINRMGLTFSIDQNNDESITIRCINRANYIVVYETTVEKIAQSWWDWDHGTLIQNAFPYFDMEEREFLMTGMTQRDWDEMAKEEM